MLLATQLDIRTFACKNIEYKFHSHPDSPQQQLNAMMALWHADGAPLSKLIQALQAVDEENLAETLKRKYI